MSNPGITKQSITLSALWCLFVTIWTLCGYWGLSHIDASKLTYVLFWGHCLALLAPIFSRVAQACKDNQNASLET